jgi:hypothetical protein
LSTPLTPATLDYSVDAKIVVDVNCNNEDAIDRLLKVRDKLLVYRDKNSIIFFKSGEVVLLHILIMHIIF